MNKRLFASLFGLLAVSGCSTYSLQELRQTTPQGSVFQNHLAKLYMDFAGEEEKSYDWQDSWYFADKGLMAAYGKETLPEDLANWNLSEDVKPQFEKARADLERLLTPEKIQKQPEIAARAQFYYDCWLEQQEEGWQKDEIDYCKTEYLKALSRLEGGVVKPAKTSAKKKTVPSAKNMTKEQPKEVAKEPEIVKEAVKEINPITTSFITFFNAGESDINTTAENVLIDVAKSLAGQQSYVVVVTNKSKDTKETLFDERFAAIKKKLVDSGVKESAITNGMAGGDSNIKRKVEIFIND